MMLGKRTRKITLIGEKLIQLTLFFIDDVLKSRGYHPLVHLFHSRIGIGNTILKGFLVFVYIRKVKNCLKSKKARLLSGQRKEAGHLLYKAQAVLVSGNSFL